MIDSIFSSERFKFCSILAIFGLISLCISCGGGGGENESNENIVEDQSLVEVIDNQNHLEQEDLLFTNNKPVTGTVESGDFILVKSTYNLSEFESSGRQQAKTIEVKYYLDNEEVASGANGEEVQISTDGVDVGKKIVSSKLFVNNKVTASQDLGELNVTPYVARAVQNLALQSVYPKPKLFKAGTNTNFASKFVISNSSVLNNKKWSTILESLLVIKDSTGKRVGVIKKTLPIKTKKGDTQSVIAKHIWSAAVNKNLPAGVYRYQVTGKLLKHNKKNKKNRSMAKSNKKLGTIRILSDVEKTIVLQNVNINPQSFYPGTNVNLNSSYVVDNSAVVNDAGVKVYVESFMYINNSSGKRIKAVKKLIAISKKTGVTQTVPSSLTWTSASNHAVPAGDYRYEHIGQLVKIEGGKKNIISKSVKKSGSLTIIEEPSNSPPIAQDDSMSLKIGMPYVEINVLLNDSDPDGDSIAVTSVTNGSRGLVSKISNEILRYTLTNSSNTEIDTFSYSISDVGGHTATASVQVSIINDDTLVDNDNDRLDDLWEFTHFGGMNVSDGSGDQDDDGVNDLKEFENNTNPNLSDTDGDGSSDGDEIASGTDPNDKDKFPGLLVGVIEGAKIDKVNLELKSDSSNHTLSDENGNFKFKDLSVDQEYTLTPKLAFHTFDPPIVTFQFENNVAYKFTSSYKENSDVDGDGISDYDEIYNYRTDPYVVTVDSDGDKIPDSHDPKPNEKAIGAPADVSIQSPTVNERVNASSIVVNFRIDAVDSIQEVRLNSKLLGVNDYNLNSPSSFTVNNLLEGKDSIRLRVIMVEGFISSVTIPIVVDAKDPVITILEPSDNENIDQQNIFVKMQTDTEDATVTINGITANKSGSFFYQWIKISDLEPGQKKFTVVVNEGTRSSTDQIVINYALPIDYDPNGDEDQDTVANKDDLFPNDPNNKYDKDVDGVGDGDDHDDGNSDVQSTITIDSPRNGFIINAD